jgi:hypothetical protein
MLGRKKNENMMINFSVISFGETQKKYSFAV